MSTFTRIFANTISTFDKKALEPIALCLTAFIPLTVMVQSITAIF